jgi:hypothetical protein
MTVEFPAAPGRKALSPELSVSFGTVEILRPASRKASSRLPDTIAVMRLIGREHNPAPSEEPALWFLVTTHCVNDIADARRIIGFLSAAPDHQTTVPDHEDQRLRC